MKYALTYAALLGMPLLAQAEPQKPGEKLDMIRFSEQANHDTLHGRFVDFSDTATVRFQSTEAKEPILFSTEKLHRITLGAGRAQNSLSPASNVILVNGDVIPGKIISVVSDSVTIETQHLGRLKIPTDGVATISPTPHGGKLLYYGPLNDDGWECLYPPKKKAENADEEQEESAEEKKEDEKAERSKEWNYVAGAWYAGTSKECYLTLKNSLEDRCKVSFKLAWKGSLYCNIALHADFAAPEREAEKTTTRNMAASVGRGYVLSLSSHSATLYECKFGEDGEPISERLSQQRVSMNLSRSTDAEIELRLDRPNKAILLYHNGSFKCKWDLGEKYIGTGNHLAFNHLRYSNGELRLSELTISKWNGLKDSAQSMQSDKRDMILLNNGVDRFSGTFKSIRDGKVYFRGTFDNDLTIPMNSVQEIHFAANKLRKLPEDHAENTVRFHMQPFGRISAKPAASSNGKTKILSEFVGDVNLDMKFVNLIDFSNQNNLLDFWNENF